MRGVTTEETLLYCYISLLLVDC